MTPNQKIKTDGLIGTTMKLSIIDSDAEHDFYFTLAWYDEYLRFVQLKASGKHRYAIQALLELVSIQATTLLCEKVWTPADLITQWRGSSFNPHGTCKQLDGPFSLVKSPLDAVAKYMTSKGYDEE